MNLVDGAILAGVAGAFALALRSWKKNGGGCSGSCAGCAARGGCAACKDKGQNNRA